MDAKVEAIVTRLLEGINLVGESACNSLAELVDEDVGQMNTLLNLQVMEAQSDRMPGWSHQDHHETQRQYQVTKNLNYQLGVVLRNAELGRSMAKAKLAESEEMVVSLQAELDSINATNIDLLSQLSSALSEISSLKARHDILKQVVQGRPTGPSSEVNGRGLVPYDTGMSSHLTLSHHQPAIQSQKSRDITVQDPTNLDQHKDKYLALLTDTTADPFNFLGAQQTVNEFATTKQHVEKQKEVSSAVSESFARFQRNFVLSTSTSGSNHVHPPHQPDTHHADAPAGPPSTPVLKGKGKAVFNPECAPFVPSSLKTESTPKLSPLSQPFTPPEIKIEQRLTPPHKRLPIKKISSTEAIFQKSLDLASTSGNESPPNSVSKSQSPLNAIKAEDESREAEDKASSISAAPKLPPHLRGLSAKTSTQLSHPVLAPEVTAALQLVDPFCDAVPATEKENETMQNWLDTLEQGIKVSAEPSQFDPMPGSSDKLIDLDSGETGEASNTAAVPGWTEVALPTPVKKRLTLEEFDKDIRDHVERLLNDAPEGKERLAVLKELLVMLRACLAESRAKQPMSAAPEDEGYHTANPVDPHLNGHEQGDIGATEQPTHPTSTNTDEAQSDAATLSSLASKWNHINENDGTVGIVMEVSAQMDKVSRSGKYGKAPKSKKTTADETRCEMDDYLDPDYIPDAIIGTHTLGATLDHGTKSLIMHDTPASRGQDKSLVLGWKPVSKGGRQVFVL